MTKIKTVCIPHKTMLTSLSLYSYDEISSIFYQVLIITAAEILIDISHVVCCIYNNSAKSSVVLSY